MADKTEKKKSTEKKELTEKQKRFIDYYIQYADATKAAIEAGYSKKTARQIGSENLSKLDLLIQERLKKKEKERIASQNEVLEYFTTIMRKKSENTNDRTKCAELLGKRYGMFREQVDLEVNQDEPFEVNINIKKN